MFRIRTAICAVALLVGFACGGLCYQAPGISITNSSLTSEGDVELCVSVTDSAGRPVRGLCATNFRPSISGEPAAFDVDSVDDGSPLAVILAIDTSLSMAGEPMASVKDGAKAFIDQLDPRDAVCLVTFSSDVRVAADYTDDHEQLETIIDGLDAAGANTLLYSALVTCSRVAARAPSSRCAVVLLTDGKDEGSSVPLHQAIDEAEKCACPFYTLGYGNQANCAVLARISELTGGRFRRISTPDQTVSLYREIAQDLTNQYRVRVQGPFSPGWRTFVVEANIAGHVSRAQRRVYIPLRDVESNSPSMIWLLVICAALVVARVIYRRARRSGNARWDDDEGRDGMDAYDSNTGWTTADPSDVQPIGTITRGPQVWIEVVRGPHQGVKFALTGKPVRIGRGSDCDLSLDKDGAVSRSHAEITFDSAGDFVLRDLGSKNGTRIEGNELGSRTVHLRDGDRISLGATELIYRDERPKRKPR